MQLSVALYKLTAAFPKEELFGLTSQLRRAGVSTASNIAEGYGRNTTGEYRHFLGMARGSNLEVQTQLIIAGELGFGASEKSLDVEKLSNEVSRMLVALMRALKERPKESKPAHPNPPITSE